MKNVFTYIGKLLRTRDFWIRVLFIGIAAFFWLLIKLSKGGYVSTLAYPVLYENIPQSKVMSEAPEDEITLRVSSFGFRLLGYELKNVDPIKIDVKRKARQLNRNKNIYYWLPNLYREELEAQLDGQTSLLRLEPDTVFFVLSDRVKKTVPVISKLKKEYAPGYLAYNKEELKPSSVVISGPKILIDSIKSVQTKGRVISAISGDINQKVKIDFSHDLITVNPQIVQYKQEVDQFTEKELDRNYDLG